MPCENGCGERSVFQALAFTDGITRQPSASPFGRTVGTWQGWFSLDIQEHTGGFLVQVWAVVVTVPPELCAEPSADGVDRPDVEGPMNHDRANALRGMMPVYLDDRFHEWYEQSTLYRTVPVNVHGRWLCSPSY